MHDIALSFDNGPDSATTPQVLDALAGREIPALFCVLGERLARPELRRLAERAHAEGHWLANHTYTHSVPLGRVEDPERVRREIDLTQELLGELVHPDRLFRPFGGGGHLDERLLNETAVDHLVAGGYTVVTWNAVPGDWKDPDGWLPRALEMCRAEEHVLLVLHDLPTGAMAHLETFLDTALDEGARFVRELPEACTPIVRGEVVGPLDGLVSDTGSRA
ncbi:MAG: peptidoglycan-N-acetylglucosamine deacetylase [Solirubrobacteraceae bacterium]|nr:peptidoglycan-N-acetylglucosamine deacetylase [Solirubrobacteraceae bacterium]